MRKLRTAGNRLIALNAQIAEQHRLIAAAEAAIRDAEQAEKKRLHLARISRLKRKATYIAAAEALLALSHVLRNNTL
jgi:hypothetical protein